MIQVKFETTRLLYPALESSYGPINKKYGSQVCIEESVDHAITKVTVIVNVKDYSIAKELAAASGLPGWSYVINK